MRNLLKARWPLSLFRKARKTVAVLVFPAWWRATASFALLCATAGLVITCGAHAPNAHLPTPAVPELWYYHHSYLTTDRAEDSSRVLIDKAVAAGYTGLVLWDSGLDFLGSDNWPPENEDRMRDVLHYAAKKHLKLIAAPAIYGNSNEMLEANPNWAESQRVVGTEFTVDKSGRKLVLKNSFPGLANGGFEAQKEAWFDTGDRGAGISEVAHSGKASAVVVDAPGNARFRQTFPLKPWRQYHVRLFFKSSKFRGGPMISVFDGKSTDHVYLNANIDAKGDHDWTQLDYTFNSEESTSGQLYFGVWGGSGGTLWFDDVSIEETAFVYLTRRAGAPLKIYSPGHAEKAYQEGGDVDRIADPRMSDPKAFVDEYHEPPVVTLPKNTRLKPGDTVAIDSYAAQPIPGLHSVSMCMTEPGTFRWIERNAKTIHHVLPKENGGIFLGYDEIRQANSCESCRAKKMTAGQLLAWSLGQTYGIYTKAAPGRPLYLWNDMFDPYHNARKDYYHVEGDLAESWTALPADVAIMNWNLDHLHQSLAFFAGMESRQPVAHQQVIAGYYDTGDGAKAATAELQAARGVAGLQGLMYTTWSDDYSQLKPFANAVKAGWKEYLDSLK